MAIFTATYKPCIKFRERQVEIKTRTIELDRQLLGSDKTDVWNSGKHSPNKGIQCNKGLYNATKVSLYNTEQTHVLLRTRRGRKRELQHRVLRAKCKVATTSWARH